MKESPLFWPISLRDNIIYCLDETVLPARVVYRKAQTPQQAVRLIKDMKTRAVGQVLIVFYIFLMELARHPAASRQELTQSFRRIARAIEESRPTFPFHVFTGMILGWLQAAKGDIIQELEEKIDGFLRYLRESRLQRAEVVSRLIKNKSRILTHCNISGEMVAIAQACRKQRTTIEFFATETRPYLQGSRLTAWELRQAGFSVTVIPDSAVAQVLSRGLIDVVIVGSDRSTRDEAVINKVGTYQIASLADEFKVPVFCLTQPASADRDSKDVVIEERPSRELLYFNGKRITTTGVKGYYPAFDITPRELIAKQIPLF